MRILYTLSLLLIISHISAQPNLGSWQWAKKAGGVFNTANRENEVINDICTDKNGNVYTTGIVYQYPYFEGVRYTAPFASFGYADAFVAKYDKCGHLKWVRFGGGSQDDQAYAVQVDDSLNVYSLGSLGSYNITFPDSNHTLTASHPGLFWAKYDSLGNIKWLNTSNNQTGLPNAPSKLIARPNGNLSTVLLLDTGIFYPGFSFRSSHLCDAIFEFNLNGGPVSILPIDSFGFNTTYLNLNFGDIAYDSKGNLVLDYFIFDTIKLFDTILYSPSGSERNFLVKVDYQTSKIKWAKEWKEDQYQSSAFSSVLVDKNDNIITNGSGGLNAVFNGDSIKFNTTAALDMQVCFKLDSNGNTLWHIVADNTNNSNVLVYPEPITLYGDKYICIPINVSGPTYWGGDTFNSIGTNPQTWTTPYVITFINTNTGKVEFGDSIAGGASTLNTSITKIVSDEQGSVYLGGFFSWELETNTDTITYTGGINDGFVIKWGLPCPDTTAIIPPLAAEDLVAYAAGQHAIDVNWHNVAQYADRYRVYRSTTDSLTGYSLIDSVSKYTSHYTDVNIVANQIYWYRVSAVNGAGVTFSNSDSAIIIPSGITDITSAIQHIALYPNPANNYTELSVWSDASSSFLTNISITDMEGREFYFKQTEITQGKNDFVIDMSNMSAGVYVVNIHCNNGTYSKRLVLLK